MAISPMSAPGSTELSQQFMAHSEAILKANSLALDSLARPMLQQDFDNAAIRMTADNRLSPFDIGEAHDAVGLYSEAIVVGVRTSSPVPASLIQPNIIQKVRNFFCPGFWPFC